METLESLVNNAPLIIYGAIFIKLFLIVFAVFQIYKLIDSLSRWLDRH